MWVWKLVSHCGARLREEVYRKWGAEEDIWTEEVQSNRMLEEISQRGDSRFDLLTKYYREIKSRTATYTEWPKIMYTHFDMKNITL